MIQLFLLTVLVLFRSVLPTVEDIDAIFVRFNSALAEHGWSLLDAQLLQDVYSAHLHNPNNAALCNLMGVISHQQGDNAAAIAYFRSAVLFDNFTTQGYLDNYIATAYSDIHERNRKESYMDVIDTLAAGIWKSPESYAPRRIAMDALLDLYLNRLHDEQQYYSLLLNATLMFPAHYDYWVRSIPLLVRLDIPLMFGGIAQLHMPIAGTYGDVGITIPLSQWIDAGLQRYPRCPGLLYLHAMWLHWIVQNSNTVAGIEQNMSAVCCCSALLERAHASIELATAGFEFFNSVDFRTLLDASKTLTLCPLSLLESAMNFGHCFPYSRLETVDLNTTELQNVPKLQVGCAEWEYCVRPDHWFIVDTIANISTHFITSALDLHMVADRSVSMVYASHVLEHLQFTEYDEFLELFESSYRIQWPRHNQYLCNSPVCTALREWRRVLIVGGELLVSVPDVEQLAKLLTSTTSLVSRLVLLSILYGGQKNEFDKHQSGFDYQLLRMMLEVNGFCNIRRVDGFDLFPGDTSDKVYRGVPISINVRAERCDP